MQSGDPPEWLQKLPLVGGYDTSTHNPHLYWIDYLGTMSEVPFAAHGYGAYFALSLLDR